MIDCTCAYRYRSTFTPADASAYALPRGHSGGGYWFETRQREAAGNTPPFRGTSTYQAELLHGGDSAAAQLAAAEDVSTTQSTTPSLHLGGGVTTASRTSTGQSIGYRSTYSSATSLVARQAEAARLAAMQRPASCPGAQQQQPSAAVLVSSSWAARASACNVLAVA